MERFAGKGDDVTIFFPILREETGKGNAIMPMDKTKYPKNWSEISKRIRFERAGNCCEWCGVWNHSFREGTWIVLTVAHLGIDKPDGTPGDKADTMDCREENLAALCQRCHLNFDRADHIRNRRKNARRRLVEAGQQEMF